jgi:hypothetical protein
MHDYTVRLLHEDRMAQLTREADAFRLASEAWRADEHHPARRFPSLASAVVRARAGVWAALTAFASR